MTSLTLTLMYRYVYLKLPTLSDRVTFFPPNIGVKIGLGCGIGGILIPKSNDAGWS